MYGLHGKTLKATIGRNTRTIEAQKSVLTISKEPEVIMEFIAKLAKKNALLIEAIKLNKNNRQNYLEVNGYYD
jgi:hypothetical protein